MAIKLLIDSASDITKKEAETLGMHFISEIITFGTMAAKNAIKDVGRVLRVPYNELDKVTKAIPNNVKRPVIEKVFGLNRKPDKPDESLPELVEMYNTNPNIKKVVDHVHSRGAFASLHSDGCISSVADGIVDIGLDVIHPWQESAGMSYDLYLEKYSDKFSIL